jgi:hypothetical protein
VKKLLGLTFVLAIIAGPALAQKITIDYARDFDFDSVETFTYIETKDSNMGNDLMDNRVRDEIIREMKEGGLKQVESGADIYITFHVTSEDNTTFHTTGYGYGGYGPGWGGYGRYGYGRRYGGGYGGATTTATTYTKGTLIVDAYEPGKKELVWRGTGTVTVKEKPAKQEKQLKSILTKMGKQWEKILKEMEG